MADVFVSYARADKARVAPLVAAIEAKGWSVWWDPEISPGQEFDDQIDGELMSAKAVLVVWTPTSVTSRWVRGEARDAADRNVLVPVRFEQARLPIDVRAIHTTDMDGWNDDAASPQAKSCLHALATMIAHAAKAESVSKMHAPEKVVSRHCSVCVLPFTNMSGDPEQEYFSDGISEDIITDLSKVSALEVASRNSSFAYKGKQANVRQVAGELKVTHVLEGSVRRAGGRLRISAQLTDVASDRQVWGERYDRDADDIFALQDEISHAIVKALKVHLLPEERRAIRHRGTDNPEAHDLYLMARQMYSANMESDDRLAGTIMRICQRATELDPDYAQAWALMAAGYRNLHELDGQADDGMAAAERALALDPDFADAHAVKALILLQRGDTSATAAEVAIALELDPESNEANRAAGRLNYQMKHYEDAIRFYEKAARLMDGDQNSANMLISCYGAVGDAANVHRAAELALKRAEAILAKDQYNAGVLSYSAFSLAALGEGERAKARITRALLIQPDNFNVRYNFACFLAVHLKDGEGALALLGPVFATISPAFLTYAKTDPDFASIRDDPRFKSMVAAAEARLASEKDSVAAETAA